MGRLRSWSLFVSMKRRGLIKHSLMRSIGREIDYLQLMLMLIKKMIKRLMRSRSSMEFTQEERSSIKDQLLHVYKIKIIQLFPDSHWMIIPKNTILIILHNKSNKTHKDYHMNAFTHLFLKRIRKIIQNTK